MCCRQHKTTYILKKQVCLPLESYRRRRKCNRPSPARPAFSLGRRRRRNSLPSLAFFFDRLDLLFSSFSSNCSMPCFENSPRGNWNRDDDSYFKHPFFTYVSPENTTWVWIMIIPRFNLLTDTEIGWFFNTKSDSRLSKIPSWGIRNSFQRYVLVCCYCPSRYLWREFQIKCQAHLASH